MTLRRVAAWEGVEAKATIADGQLVFEVDGSTYVYEPITQEEYDARIAAIAWSDDLTDTLTDENYGYSFQVPANYLQNDETEAGEFYLYWAYPDVWVITSVDTENGLTIDDNLSFYDEDDDYDVYEATDDSLVAVTMDADGDMDFFRIVVKDGTAYMIDVYFHPDNIDSVSEGAQAVLKSLSV